MPTPPSTGRQPASASPPRLSALVVCEGCGRDSPHLRIVQMQWAWSALVVTRHGQATLLVCPPCAGRRLGSASAKTALLGWWGVPFGWFFTPDALVGNLLAAPRPLEANVSMLLHQAAAYAQRGQIFRAQQARLEAAHHARGTAALERQLQEFESVVPTDPRIQRLPDPWRLTSRNALPRIAAALLGLLVLVCAALLVFT
ncbi:hypothetical protein MF271_17300 (plasmid) [Deinococcus sp. KNUC1210]|uniref:hypothetical protein n=1 Tax=Deinococcus sp. KNUC1210 TaxID=2917691 RepID=UPI001EF12568|nr:hypothetical protein [Deinococcus sp. KNUC1210]ULH17079.1 hypothetical protein MF271_17300 [Deinococcus sp. KNUC1210]